MDLKKILLGVGRLKEEQKGGSLEMDVGKIGSRDTELGGVGKQASLRGQPAPRPAGKEICVFRTVVVSHTELAWKERHAVWPKHEL